LVSASEKLKALAVSEHPLSNPDPGDDHIGGALHYALPQIVAVVEAAERVHDEPHDFAAGVGWRPLGDALAALDEALP